MDHSLFSLNRRAFLRAGLRGAIGTLALSHLFAAKSNSARVWLPTRPSLAKARAKSVICLFQHGGPSQMDLFDPKPDSEAARQALPGKLEVHFNKQQGKLLASPFQFSPPANRGRCSASSCRTWPAIADDLTLVRSMTTESVDHEAGPAPDPYRQGPAGRPAWGSWVMYGLGPRTRICRPTSSSPIRRPAGRRRAELVERLAAGGLSGHAVPVGDARC